MKKSKQLIVTVSFIFVCILMSIVLFMGATSSVYAAAATGSGLSLHEQTKIYNSHNSDYFADGEQLKNFYRFIAQNPHINLHDACQIIIERPNATVCYSFNEWAAMDRRVTKGRKGIAYYDIDGYKQFVFDANDTHGDTRYSRPILPMKRLLGGLDELNGTEIADSEQSDYSKIQKDVQAYLNEQGEFTGDEEHDGLLTEGITYSLYSKTGNDCAARGTSPYLGLADSGLFGRGVGTRAAQT